MNCPYCNKEMIKGYIQCQTDIIWTPKKHALTTILDKDQIILARSNFLSGSTLISYICKDCKKVVIDYIDTSF